MYDFHLTLLYVLDLYFIKTPAYLVSKCSQFYCWRFCVVAKCIFEPSKRALYRLPRVR